MSINALHGTQEWVEYISEHEMPALCSTVRMLEEMACDESASLAKLGQSILHDHALTSRILKVVNSVLYKRGRNEVTTVSRATIILGFKAIKHICITAKMLDSLLRNKKLSPNVYQRLLVLLAQSLHAGTLCRSIFSDYQSDTQEEIFIAALLHHLGETAFWSSGQEITRTLDEKLIEANEAHTTVIVVECLGTSFDRISQGLAKHWHLGKVVVSSLDEPDLRSKEMQVLALVDDLSRLLMEPDKNTTKIKKCIESISKLTSISVEALEKKIQESQAETLTLITSLGVPQLTSLISNSSETETTKQSEHEFQPGDDILQLKLLRELTFLTMEPNVDVNSVLHTALEGIYRGIGLDTVVFFTFDKKHTQLVPRFFSGLDAEEAKSRFVIDLGSSSIFDKVIDELSPAWVNSLKDPIWQQYVSVKLARLLSRKGFFVAPLTVGNNKAIGAIYAARVHNPEPLTQDCFLAFNHFVIQTNLCLNKLMSA